MNGLFRAALLATAVVLPAILSGCTPIPAVPGFAGLPGGAGAPAAGGAAAAGGGGVPGGGLTALQAATLPTSTNPDLLQLSGASHITKATCGVLTAVCEHIRNQLGMKYPGLEAKPPIKSITDAANLAKDASPAVQAAAKVKAEEEQTPQKIKGLRYLASVGCGGCYPDVEDALLAGLDDCTEQVRYEAAKAIRWTVGNPCKFCKASACCGPKVRKKLKKVAYHIEKTGCFSEPSERVRRMARSTLCLCGNETVFDDVPEEGPEEEKKAADGEQAEEKSDEDKAPAEEKPDEDNTVQHSPSAGLIELVAGTDTANPIGPGPIQTAAHSKTGLVVDEAHRATPSTTLLTWEQIMIDPAKFDSVDRARQVIIYLRARARGLEIARPEFTMDEISVERIDWMPENDIDWAAAREQLMSMPVEGISPILTREDRWYLIRLLGRRTE